MSRRSDGDAMPGWSTILRVDKSSLGLEDARDDEGTLHDGGTDETGSPFDETTEPPLDAPPPPSRSPNSVVVPSRTPVPSAPSRVFADPASTNGRAVSLREDAPIENLTGDEFTQLDQPAPAELRVRAPAGPEVTTQTPAVSDDGESTTLDRPLSEVLGRPSASVQVQGVVGERIPAVIVRRAPEARPSEVRPAEQPPSDVLLRNAPVQGRGGGAVPEIGGSTAELTQINAAAALGIAPEPAGPPPPLMPAEDAPADKTPPPALPRVDFGALKLAEKEEVMARYPVETPGLSAAERLGAKVPTVRAVSKVLPVLIMGGIALSFVGVFLVGPLGDMLQAGERQSAREALRAAQVRATEEAETHALPLGSIRVVTEPTKAAVEVDGYYLGRSPMMIAPPEERPRYVFRISAEGHKTWQGILRVENGGYVVDIDDGAESAGASSVAADGPHHKLLVTLEKN